VTIIVKPIEGTQVGAIGASNIYEGTQANELRQTASNGAALPKSGASVDSTVQFIRAHYDSLFRRLAD
jgi:hypothetical protein